MAMPLTGAAPLSTLARSMRHTKELATPHTQCLFYATYWFRPLLSELLGAAKESVDSNREPAPSGPVEVALSPKPHSRQLAGVIVVSDISTVITWFLANWASKIALFFLKGKAGLPQTVQEVSIQNIRGVERPRTSAASSGADIEPTEESLRTVWFADNKFKAPRLDLGIDEELTRRNSLRSVIDGYSRATLLSLLEVITPSEGGITPERWPAECHSMPPQLAK